MLLAGLLNTCHDGSCILAHPTVADYTNSYMNTMSFEHAQSRCSLSNIPNTSDVGQLSTLNTVP